MVKDDPFCSSFNLNTAHVQVPRSRINQRRSAVQITRDLAFICIRHRYDLARLGNHLVGNDVLV